MSIAYTVRHQTRFEYPIPVSVCHNILCLTPRPSASLTIRHAGLLITPQPTVETERKDSFGNITTVFSIEEPHEAMAIDATASVVVHPPARVTVPGPACDKLAEAVMAQDDPRWLEAFAFLFDSPLVMRSQVAREFGEAILRTGRTIYDAAIALTEAVHDQFTYLPGSTHVGTTSTQALSERRGVCQDFAHVQIAVLRSFGLPARYVSGYLRTLPPPGQPRLVGADQSHAWVSVYAGPELGWIDMDPTNRIPCGTDHIPLAIGRDYSDVAPIRGAFLGGGESVMSVSVDVVPVEDTQDAKAAGLPV